MHGEAHDFVVINTIKDSHKLGSIKRSRFIKKARYESLKKQRRFNKILDVGSLDTCGSQKTYENGDWLKKVSKRGTTYTGIDLISGRGVDYVMNSHEMGFETGSFDLVLCLNMLEHDDNKLMTFREMRRVMASGGLLIVTGSSEDGPEHGDEWGFYGGISKKEMRSYLSSWRDVWVVKDGGYIYAKATK